MAKNQTQLKRQSTLEISGAARLAGLEKSLLQTRLKYYPLLLSGINPALLRLRQWWQRQFPQAGKVLRRDFHGRGVAAAVRRHERPPPRTGEPSPRRLRFHVQRWQEGIIW